MRALIALPVAVALLFATAPADAAEEVVCGHVLGSSAPTATAPGSFVIPQPGDVAPAGTYILLPAGTQFTPPLASAWVCVRTTIIPPTAVFGGNIATHSFVEFVQPGSPGYRAEPTAAPQVTAAPRATAATGSLPNTSTAEVALPLLVTLALGLLALALARGRATA